MNPKISNQNPQTKLFKAAYSVRARHGVLHEAIKLRGWKIKQAAEFLGLHPSVLSSILSLKARPPRYTKVPDGKERFAALEEKLMELTGKSFEELFPDEVYNDEVMENARAVDFFVERNVSALRLEPSSNASVITVDGETGSAADYGNLVQLIRDSLSKRQWGILDYRFLQGMTLEEVGKILKISPQRVRQIEGRALRRLRGKRHVLDILSGNEDTAMSQIFKPEVMAAIRDVGMPGRPKE